MSEPKFTPGPWSWDDEVPTDYISADWQNIAPWLVDGNGNGVITGQISCQNPANTQLIAAAPDLYGELYHQVLNCPLCKGTGISVDTLHYVMTGEEVEQDCIRCRGGRNALAKARGES